MELLSIQTTDFHTDLYMFAFILVGKNLNM